MRMIVSADVKLTQAAIHACQSHGGGVTHSEGEVGFTPPPVARLTVQKRHRFAV